MPRTYEIQTADGKTYEIEVPDSYPDQISRGQGATPKTIPAKTPPQEGLPSGSTVLSGVKNLAAGAVEGLTSVPRLFAEGSAALQDTQSAFASRRNREQPNAMSADLKAALPEPQNDADKYLRSLGEGMGGAMAGPGSIPSRLMSGAASGVGGEVGDRFFGPLGRLLGGMAGGSVPNAIPGWFKGNEANLAQRGLWGVTDGPGWTKAQKDAGEVQLKEAISKMEAAAKAGNPITLGQALGRQSSIDSIETALANSDHGQRVQGIFRDQPTNLADLGNRVIDKLPGEVKQPGEAANGMQDAATAAIEAVKKWRTGQVQRYYADGGQIPDNMVTSMQTVVRARAAQHPNTALGDALNDLADRMVVKADPARNIVSGSSGKPLVTPSGGQLKIQDPDKPITDLNQLNDVLKQVQNNLKVPALNKAAVDAKTDKEISMTIQGLRDDLGLLFPSFKAGNQLYRSLSENVVDPMKRSITGVISGRTGAQMDKPAGLAVADSLFKKGTTPGGVSNILTAERDMRMAAQKADPNAVGSQEFVDAAKSWLTRTLNEQNKGTSAGTTPDFAKNVQNLFSNQVQYQGFKDTMVGMARSMGLKDDALLPGVENFLKLVSMQAKRPTSIRGMNAQEIASEAGQNLVSDTARVASFVPAEKLARRIEGQYQAHALEVLDRLLTSPDGVRELQELAKKPVMSKAAQAAVQGMLGGLTSSDQLP